MARGNIVAAAGAIAQMPHEQLATKVEVLLYRFGKLGMDDAGFDLIVVLTKQTTKYPVQRVGLDIALAKHERRARGHVEFDAGNSRSVLTSVVLLLHQKEKFGEAPK